MRPPAKHRIAFYSATLILVSALAFAVSIRSTSPVLDQEPRTSEAVSTEPGPMPPEIQARFDDGIAHLEAGQLGQALKDLETAAALADGHPESKMHVLNWLGLASKRLGDHHRSLDCYSEALELAKRLGRREFQATILHNMGTSYTALGESRLALDALEDALAAQTRTWDRAITLTAIATQNDLEGNHALAITQLHDALALRRASLEIPEGPRRLGLATTLDRLGTAEKNAGQPDRARRAFESSRSLLKQERSTVRQAIVESNLARLLFDMGDFRAGLERLAWAGPVLENAGLRWEYDIALLAKAQGLAELGQLDEAARLADEAIERIESLRQDVPGPHLRSTFLASHHVFYEQAISLAMSRHAESPSAGHDREALELAERAMARSLLDLLRQPARSSRLRRDSDLRTKVDDLESELRELEHLRLDGIRRRAPISEIAELEKKQRALILANDSAWSLAGANSAPEPRLDVASMQNLLDPETRFLVFSLGDKESYLWIVSPNDVESHRLAGRDTIERAAVDARMALERSDQPGRGPDDAPIVLSSLLLPDDRTLAKGLRLVVFAGGGLQRIPFGALPKPSTGEPLLAEHAVIQLPSISALHVLRLRELHRQRAPGNLVIVADPIYGGSDPRLPASVDDNAGDLERLTFSRHESETILRLVPANARLGLSGFDARRDFVLDGSLDKYQIVHLSVHGELNEERPELTSLVFSQLDEKGGRLDGRVFMHEIASLSLPADLVVLSACNSALGRNFRGEGLVGLTRAVFLAGANRALVSLWYVDDQATAELMILFYEGLLGRGLDPGQALREAQLRLPMLDERWSAPYYWAGFVLQGDWRWPDGGQTENELTP